MKTTFWGPHAWKFLHAVTFAYPDQPSDEHKKAALELFSSLKYMLPCGECCSHYCQAFEKNRIEPYLESRDSLSKWLVDFHNRVNERLGKPIMKYEEVAKEYNVANEFCSMEVSCAEQSNSNSSKNILQTTDKIFFIVAILFATFFIFKFLRKA